MRIETYVRLQRDGWNSTRLVTAYTPAHVLERAEPHYLIPDL